MLSFNIKEVAEKVGVTPATIRNWEKNDLFTAKRTENNYRTYSMEDITILKEIKRLSVEEKLNKYSIKKIINQKFSISNSDTFQFQAVNPDQETSMEAVIKKWKDFRKSNKLTLEDISKDTGISVSYLSKIENSNANISMDILNKLSAYCGESLISFPKQTDKQSYVVRKNERLPINIELNGVYVESLIYRPDTIMRPTIFTVLPHSGQYAAHNHEGEEFVLILKGSINFTLEEEEYYLEQNDSISFNAHTFHAWFNRSDYITEMLWVHSPLSSKDI